MVGTVKIFCIREKFFSHRKNNLLFLSCNMAAGQNLYTKYQRFISAVLIAHIHVVKSVASLLEGQWLCELEHFAEHPTATLTMKLHRAHSYLIANAFRCFCDRRHM